MKVSGKMGAPMVRVLKDTTNKTHRILELSLMELKRVMVHIHGIMALVNILDCFQKV